MGQELDEEREELDEEREEVDEEEQEADEPDPQTVRPWEHLDKLPGGGEWIPERLRKAARAPKAAPMKWTLKSASGPPSCGEFYDGEFDESSLETWLKEYAARWGVPVSVRVRGGKPLQDIAQGAVVTIPGYWDRPELKASSAFDKWAEKALENPDKAFSQVETLVDRVGAKILPIVGQLMAINADATVEATARRTAELLKER